MNKVKKKAISLQYLKVVPVGPPSESNFEKKIVPAPRFIVLKMGLHHLSRRAQDDKGVNIYTVYSIYI